MKKILCMSICMIFLLVACGNDTKEVPVEKKSETKADVKKETPKHEKQEDKAKELTAKARTLAKENKLPEAIAVIDEIIKLKGEDRAILRYKHSLLMKLDKYEAALKVALRMDEVAKRKSPWNCISIAETYMKLNHHEKAIEYLAIAVKERQFNNMNHLKGDAFAPLKENKNFLALFEEMKNLIGIGKAAKDFTVKLIDGSEYKLSAQKGSVVLIDFWAVWCPPCRKAIPGLVKLYGEVKDQGFKIIGISLDQDIKKHEAYIKEQGMTWDLSYSGKGWYDDTVKLYNVSSIPSTWLIDREGHLRYFDIEGEELVKAVKELLAVKPKK